MEFLTLKKMMFFQGMMVAGLLGLSGIAVAVQSPPAGSSSTESAAPKIETGAILYAELSKTLDAKKTKTGDPVTALLLADVLFHGKIVAHRDSKLIGHVTEVQAHSKETPESRLGIAFEKVILKGGQMIPFSSVLIALHPAVRLAVHDPPSGPTPTGVAPGSQVDKHYPAPGATPKKPSDTRMDSSLGGEMDSNSRAITGSGPTDIDGLSLATSGGSQAIVSLERTVKLESGVTIELRVIGSTRQ
jgi:hypothetical protein